MINFLINIKKLVLLGLTNKYKVISVQFRFYSTDQTGFYGTKQTISALQNAEYRNFIIIRLCE